MGRATALASTAAFLSMLIVFVLKTLSDAAFLDAFGPAYVPHFITAEALIMVVAGTGYGALIRRRPRPGADLVLLLLLSGAAFAAPLALERGGLWLAADALALVTLPALMALAVWNGATSVVSGRRARTFIPRAGAAATAGAVVGGFASSQVIDVTNDIDILGTIGGFLALIMLVLHLAVLGQARARANRHRATEAPALPSQRRRMSELSRRLVLVLTAAALAEAVLSAVIDFGFKNAIYGEYERQHLGTFFAYFYGTTNVLILLFQLVAGTRLLQSMSLRISLGLGPATLAAGAALWTVAPVLALAVFTRGSEAVLKFGIARPAQEIALTPLRQQQRQRWKVLLRGVFAQLGAAAAGVGLIVTTPRLIADPALIPAIILVLALGWLVLQHLVGRAYLRALASAIGLRHLSIEHERQSLQLDREAVRRIVELAGDGDPHTAHVGRELLTTAVADSSVLAGHLAHPDPGMRRVLFEILARQPSRACREPLRRAVAAEQDDEALAVGLTALAALGDRSAVARCRTLAGEAPTTPLGIVRRAAWAYLAEVGALRDRPEQHATVLAALVRADGVRAARLYADALRRRLLRADEVDAAVAEAIEDGAREAMNAAAALGRSHGLDRLLDVIERGVEGSGEALAYLDAPALGRLVMLMQARGVGATLRARVIRALRANPLPEVSEVAAHALVDEHPLVREVAANTLLKQIRHHGIEPPADLIDEALRFELDRFEIYVRARPPLQRRRDGEIVVRHRTPHPPDPGVFYRDELERQTERALSRVIGILALNGTRSRVYAAERELRAPHYQRRHRALDILQEIAAGPQRTRLFELLELYVNPVGADGGGDNAARRALDALDPWLARCASDEIEPLRQRLWALRQAIVFEDVAGEALAEVAERVDEVRIVEGDAILREGEASGSFFILLEGLLAVERAGAQVTELVPGEAFGELSLVDDAPIQATVRSSTEARLLRLDRAQFRDLFALHPEIRLGLVRGLARWVRNQRTPDHGGEWLSAESR